MLKINLKTKSVEQFVKATNNKNKICFGLSCNSSTKHTDTQTADYRYKRTYRYSDTHTRITICTHCCSFCSFRALLKFKYASVQYDVVLVGKRVSTLQYLQLLLCLRLCTRICICSTCICAFDFF